MFLFVETRAPDEDFANVEDVENQNGVDEGAVDYDDHEPAATKLKAKTLHSITEMLCCRASLNAYRCISQVAKPLRNAHGKLHVMCQTQMGSK